MIGSKPRDTSICLYYNDISLFESLGIDFFEALFLFPMPVLMSSGMIDTDCVFQVCEEIPGYDLFADTSPHSDIVDLLVFVVVGVFASPPQPS